MARAAVRLVAPPEPSEGAAAAVASAERGHAAAESTLRELEERRADLDVELDAARAAFKAKPDDREALLEKLSAEQRLENAGEAIEAQRLNVRAALLDLLDARRALHTELSSREHGERVGAPLAARQRELLMEFIALAAKQSELRTEADRAAIAALNAENEMRRLRGEAPRPLMPRMTAPASHRLSLEVALEQVREELARLPQNDPKRQEGMPLVNALLQAARDGGWPR